jgi:hypothetical protein
MYVHSSGALRRGNADVCLDVIARSKATKQSTLFAAQWIASRSLSSGAHSPDPLARNDSLKNHCVLLFEN